MKAFATFISAFIITCILIAAIILLFKQSQVKVKAELKDMIEYAHKPDTLITIRNGKSDTVITIKK